MNLHHGRDDLDDAFAHVTNPRERKRLQADARTRAAGLSTDAPDEMIQALLQHVRGQFYGEADAKRWFQDSRALLKALTWPATWLNRRQIAMPVARYDRILREIVLEIQRHGDTSKIHHFPSYLERCVRLWFVHNGEELWEEAKRLRSSLDLRFLKGLPNHAPAPTGSDPMEALAAAHRVLATGKPRAKSAKNDDSQPTLFDV